MRVAILGAGFSGLAVAWHLQQLLSCQVVIFDPAPIGGGTSGLAAGLLHPYGGLHAKLNLLGVEGMRSSLQLLNVATLALGQPAAEYSGSLRVALTEAQQIDYAASAALNHDVQWKTVQQCQGLVPGIAPFPAIFLPSAVTVNSRLYLQGLWTACCNRGAVFEQIAITSLSCLNEFDVVVVAMGAASHTLPELPHLPITPIKGQVLDLTWPASLEALPFSINSQVYLAMNEGNMSCLAGATFERGFRTTEPDIATATADLLPKVHALLPVLKEATIIGCRAGIRASTPSRLPIAKRINERCWVLAGMGSKGLLYHSLFAEKLSREILQATLDRI